MVGLKTNVLPSDARTLLKTDIVLEKSIIEPGSYIHFGLEKQLSYLITNIPLNNIHDLKLLINVDGLPLFKSSTGQVYPILISIINIPELKKIVLLIGLYYGLQKSNNIFKFLNPFIDELVDLSNRGISNKFGICLPVQFIGLCCDAPAKKRYAKYKKVWRL